MAQAYAYKGSRGCSSQLALTSKQARSHDHRRVVAEPIPDALQMLQQGIERPDELGGVGRQHSGTQRPICDARAASAGYAAPRTHCNSLSALTNGAAGVSSG